jgi:arylsulfatase A-like enzyme
VFDEMARTALRCDRFYAAASVCSPTRGSVMTGRHPVRFGCFSWGHTLRPQEITVAEALSAAGYATGHFGKWHLGGMRADAAASPGKSGFSEWASSPNFFENSPLFSHNGRVVETQGESSHVTVDYALRWIRTLAGSDQPFLAVVWFGNPHGPHVGLEEYLAPYANEPASMRHFYAEIAAMDHAMGVLRAGLRELNIADNTLLWYCSDNGGIKPNSVADLRGKKGTLYEGGVRVPGLIEWPAKIAAPRTTAIPLSTVDIYPTALALAGSPLPAGQSPLDGQSLVPLLDGKMTERDRPLGFWEYPAPGKGVNSGALMKELKAEQAAGTQKPALPEGTIDRQFPVDQFPGHAAWLDGDWKLHRTGGDNPSFQLYNLAADRSEKTDVAGQESDRVARMKEALAQWQKSVLHSLNGGDYR